MEKIKTTYIGDLRTKAFHVRSGTEIITDAPVDNQGKGEAFSPTDLLATSLGSCMLTLMGIAARDNGFSVVGTRVETTKIMVPNPRRVGELKVYIFLPPNDYTENQKELIRAAVDECPAARSLHPEIKQNICFHF